MLYQLPNGKTIELSAEQFLDLSDEEIQYLLAFNYGETLENPWFGSAICGKSFDEDLFEQDDILPLSELTNIPEEDRLEDLDLDYSDEE